VRRSPHHQFGEATGAALAVNPIEQVERDPRKVTGSSKGPRTTPPGSVGACISENARASGNSYLHGHRRVSAVWSRVGWRDG